MVRHGAATLGDLGRGVASGPGMFVVNLSLARTMMVRERYRVDLRLETFNATNSPWFSNPNTQLGSSNFGLLTTTNGTGFGINGVGGGRSAQAALKVTLKGAVCAQPQNTNRAHLQTAGLRAIREAGISRADAIGRWRQRHHATGLRVHLGRDAGRRPTVAEVENVERQEQLVTIVKPNFF